jgi:hypothetical protein
MKVKEVGCSSSCCLSLCEGGAAAGAEKGT